VGTQYRRLHLEDRRLVIEVELAAMTKEDLELTIEAIASSFGVNDRTVAGENDANISFKNSTTGRSKVSSKSRRNTTSRAAETTCQIGVLRIVAAVEIGRREETILSRPGCNRVPVEKQEKQINVIGAKRGGLQIQRQITEEAESRVCLEWRLDKGPHFME